MPGFTHHAKPNYEWFGHNMIFCMKPDSTEFESESCIASGNCNLFRHSVSRKALFRSTGPASFTQIGDYHFRLFTMGKIERGGAALLLPPPRYGKGKGRGGEAGGKGRARKKKKGKGKGKRKGEERK